MQVVCRYQYHSKDGIQWTRWFKMMGVPVATELECRETIRLLMGTFPKSKGIKLRHEYRIVEATNTEREAAHG